MVNNSSNASSMNPGDSFGIVFLSFFAILFFLIPIFIVNILLMVAIITEKTIPTIVRLILVNIVASSELVIIGLVIWNMYDNIQQLLFYPSQSDFACRLFYIVLLSGAAGRLLYMTTYAVMVYRIARLAGANLMVNKLKLWPTLIAIIMLWMTATIPNSVLFSSSFLRITFASDSVCVLLGSELTILHTFYYITVYGLCCFVLSITFPILTARYIKKNSISGDNQTLKGLTKFAVFLLIGNCINIVGISIPIFLATFTPAGEENSEFVSVLILFQAIILSLSLLPTPVVFLIFFKAVRQRFKMLICCICLKLVSKKRLKECTTT